MPSSLAPNALFPALPVSARTPSEPFAPLDGLMASLLCCPACVERPPLALRPAASADAEAALFCAACGRAYPIKNGVPYLLMEDAPGSGGAGDTI